MIPVKRPWPNGLLTLKFPISEPRLFTNSYFLESLMLFASALSLGFPSKLSSMIPGTEPRRATDSGYD